MAPKNRELSTRELEEVTGGRGRDLTGEFPRGGILIVPEDDVQPALRRGLTQLDFDPPRFGPRQP